MRKGPGTTSEQIASLREKLSPDNIAVAERLAGTTSIPILTLACKLKRERENQNKLPKAVSKILDGLSDEDATLVRTKLTQRPVNK